MITVMCSLMKPIPVLTDCNIGMRAWSKGQQGFGIRDDWDMAKLGVMLAVNKAAGICPPCSLTVVYSLRLGVDLMVCGIPVPTPIQTLHLGQI